MHDLVCDSVPARRGCRSSSLPTTPDRTASLDAIPLRRPHHPLDLPVPPYFSSYTFASSSYQYFTPIFLAALLLARAFALPWENIFVFVSLICGQDDRGIFNYYVHRTLIILALPYTLSRLFVCLVIGRQPLYIPWP